VNIDRAGYLGALLLVCSPFVAGGALAQSRTACVSDGQAPAPCAPQCTQGIFPTVGAAADALSELQANSVSDARICVPWGHVEAIQLDNSDDRVAAPLTVDMHGPVCLPEGSPQATPVLSFTPGTGAQGPDRVIPRLAFGVGAEGLAPEAVCPGAASPAIQILGDGVVAISGGWIVGYEGYAVDAAQPGTRPEVSLGGAILNGVGPVLRTSGRGIVVGLEAAGNTVGAAGGRALFEEVDQGHIGVSDSMVFGNLVLGGEEGSAEALFFGPRAASNNSAWVANGLVEVPLLLRGYAGVVEAAGDGSIEPVQAALYNMVVSRNRALASASAPGGAPAQPLVEGPESPGERCLGEAVGLPSHLRASPFESLPSGDSALVRIDADLLKPGAAALDMYRIWLLGNETGSGPLIEFDMDGVDLRGSVTHSMFADNASAERVRLVTTRGDGALAFLRNLVLGSGVAVDLGISGPATAEITMNVGVPDVTWWQGPVGVPFALLGPNQEVGLEALRFESAATVRQLAPRLQFGLIAGGSPEEEHAACSGLPQTWLCPTDRAAEFIPTSDFVDAMWTFWPWGTDFFLSDESSARAGPTGGTCILANGPLDTSRDGRWGDGDGFSHAVDCDNEDERVVPVLPSLDGFTTEDCYELENTCWECPPGSRIVDPPSTADDDDAVDDDDVVDATPSPPPGEGRGEALRGCTASGCGVAYHCDGGAAWLPLILLGPLAGRRRRW